MERPLRESSREDHADPILDAPDGVDHNQYLDFLSDQRHIAVDAGCIGFYGSPEQQARIKHVLISHTHADHVASLPIFVENAFEAGPTRHHPRHREVLDCIQRDIFNGRVWPDFIAMSATTGRSSRSTRSNPDPSNWRG